MKNIEIADRYLDSLGELDEGTLIYRKCGSDLECREWFKTVVEITSGMIVSPGGVTVHCNVSRAALHKKLNTGGLTAFCFHVTETCSTLFGKRTFIQKVPYMYIPIYDLQEWEKELQEKVSSKLRYDGDPKENNFSPLCMIAKKHKLVGKNKVE